MKLIPNLVADKAVSTIMDMFDQSAFSDLLKRAADFKTFLNGLTTGLTAGAGTVAGVAKTLAPVTNDFMASVSENLLRERVRTVVVQRLYGDKL